MPSGSDFVHRDRRRWPDLSAVNEGNWENAQKQLAEIETIYKKVASSYKS